MAQIGNTTSKSEAPIQSGTALNAGETENSVTDRLKAGQQRKHKDMRDFWMQEQVRDEDLSIKKEKNCANVGKKPIVTPVLQCCPNCKIGILQDHGSHTPLLDEGEEPRMDLAAASVCAQRPSVYTQTRYRPRRTCASGTTFRSPMTREDDRESRHFFSGPCCASTRAMMVAADQA